MEIIKCSYNIGKRKKQVTTGSYFIEQLKCDMCIGDGHGSLPMSVMQKVCKQSSNNIYITPQPDLAIGPQGMNPIGLQSLITQFRMTNQLSYSITYFTEYTMRGHKKFKIQNTGIQGQIMTRIQNLQQNKTTHTDSLSRSTSVYHSLSVIRI